MLASRRAPVRAAIIIRSCIGGLAGPVSSLRTSSSVKGRSSSSCGVAGSGILILSHTSVSTSSR